MSKTDKTYQEGVKDGLSARGPSDKTMEIFAVLGDDLVRLKNASDANRETLESKISHLTILIYVLLFFLLIKLPLLIYIVIMINENQDFMDSKIKESLTMYFSEMEFEVIE